ncbi:modular serine protease-like [Diprion similis]|uniref:modular serine protease-like n=1 Tax=Diprion similis TaxID=362088 RepID=UPI001EF7BB64|nr:modular serine protease-like [Diprion similis]
MNGKQFMPLLASGSTREAVRNSRPNNFNRWSCGEYQFACSNGDCIASELLCDGRADCSDQSDETQVECSKPELTCPDFAFRCTYGACVDGDAACNGVKDCIDNSDEALTRCPGISAAVPQARCGLEDFRCTNGQCVNSTSLCDGTVDCADRSDETALACGSFPCSQLVFRCNYGACIDGDRTCNGVRDCADGSDEDLLRCGGPTTPETVTPWTPTPTRPRTGTGSSRVFPARSSSCEIPPQPSNGHWKLHRSQCNDELNCPNPQNGELDPGTRLQYTCDPNFKANGRTEVYCESTGRWSEIPVCVEITCKSLESVSMITSCERSNDWSACGSSVRPNTTAELVCRAGYKKDSSLLDSGSKTVTCNTHGEWEPRPITCVSKCGMTNIRLTPTILNGKSADVSEFPWHASLYKQSNNSLGTKEFKCGATIVRTNILLTAAHCVYDEISNMVETPESFHVVTGNKFRDYDSPLHDSRVVRKAAVKRIYVPVEFLGNGGNYGSDVAVIELREPFQLSDILMPICMNLDGLSHQLLEAGSVGRFAGYGGTNTASSSATLLTTNISYVSYKTCGLSMGSEENRKYLTVDKFCGEGQSGTAACPGDSGGGLVFQSAGKWHILGILSLRLNKNTLNVDKTCDSEAYALFTRVYVYFSWINRLISQPPSSTVARFLRFRRGLFWKHGTNVGTHGATSWILFCGLYGIGTYMEDGTYFGSIFEKFCQHHLKQRQFIDKSCFRSTTFQRQLPLLIVSNSTKQVQHFCFSSVEFC